MIVKRVKPVKVTAASLQVLGAERLAELLLSAARSDLALKRRLALEVARDPRDLAEEVDRQIDRIRGSKGRLNGRRATLLARELTGLLDATLAKLGDVDPPAAVKRLLDVLGLAPVLLARRTGEGRPLLDALSSIGARLVLVVQDSTPRLKPTRSRVSTVQAWPTT